MKRKYPIKMSAGNPNPNPMMPSMVPRIPIVVSDPIMHQIEIEREDLEREFKRENKRQKFKRG